MNKIALIFFALISLSSCDRYSYIALKDAERGMFLDRASTVSLNTFFDRRMESELNSNFKKDWIIVNEDMEFVYFGQISTRNGFAMVNPFYKVNKERLESVFPGYRSIEGKHIKAKVFQNFVKPVLKEKLSNLCPQSYKVKYSKRDYSLSKDGIVSNISFIGKCYEERIFRADIHLLLDSKNLDVISSDTQLK